MLSSAPPSESDSKVHRATNNPPLHFIWAPVASPRNIPHFTATETHLCVICYGYSYSQQLQAASGSSSFSETKQQ